MAYETYVYNRVNWKNETESLETPLGQQNLNRMDLAIYEIANRLDVAYQELSTSAVDRDNIDKLITDMPTYDEETGLLTIHFHDGTTFQVNFNVGSIPVTFSMDSSGVITMETESGQTYTASIGDMIPDYTFLTSDRISFQKVSDGNGGYNVTADLVAGSITEEYLETNFLTQIKQNASSSGANADNASTYANNASFDAKLAQSYAVGGSGVRSGEDTDNAKYYKEQAELAKTTVETAISSIQSYASSASQSAIDANGYAVSAGNDKDAVTTMKTAVETAVADIDTKVTSASQSATTAENYAVGDTDSAKHYYEESKDIYENLTEIIKPKDTFAFANLPNISTVETGGMYSIVDEFETTADFQGGAGQTVQIGSAIYKGKDNKWHVFGGFPTVGVKGNSELAYRHGNVNITKDNIGLSNVENKSSAKIRSEITPEDISTALGFEPIDTDVIEKEIEELKKSVSDGKGLVAEAITDKGVETATDATFETMAENIGKIEGGGGGGGGDGTYIKYSGIVWTVGENMFIGTVEE